MTAPPPSRTPGAGGVTTGQEHYTYVVYIDWQSPGGDTRRVPYYLNTGRRLTASEATDLAMNGMNEGDLAPPTSPLPPGYDPYERGSEWEPIRGTLGSVSFQ